MRFIHTSDWHLGQTLHNFERAYEHQCFLDWLLLTLEQEQVDALLVAGDIFDTANPSAAAQKQFYRFLQQAKQRLPHLNIVIIAGNHDSPGRLEAPAPLLETLGVQVIGFVPRLEDGNIDISRLVLPLQDAQGQVQAWCLAIPFLRPGDVPRVELPPESSADPYLLGIATLYQQALDYALSQRQAEQAIIALGHCHMVGGEVSEDSERRIVIGGTEALSANIFGPEIAYAALGHLHLAQRVGKQEHLRYCGSPLPLSFAEVDYRHQVLCVDLAGHTVRQVLPLFIPRAVPLLRIPAQPAALEQVLAELKALELEPEPDLQRQPYLEVRVQLDAPEPGLRAQIEAAIADKPIRLAKIETRLRAASSTEAITHAEALEHLQPEDIFKRLYRSRYEQEAPADLCAALGELLSAPEDGQ